MEVTGSDKRIDNEPIKLRSDPSRLIESVRESILMKIEEINSSADHEIAEIDADIRAELEHFRASQQQKYEMKVEYEMSRMKNLSLIEMKKQKLEVMESFINTLMTDAGSLLRGDSRYGNFLKECVANGLKEVKGGSATVLISAEDMNFFEELMNEISKGGYNCSVSIQSDDRAGMGGALVIDDETEVVYNNSVERIIYRKSGEIRREILRGLKDLGAYQGD